MTVKNLLTTLIVCVIFVFSAKAQTTQELSKQANEEVQAEMKIYHDKLNLTPEQTYAVMQILKDKKERKEAILNEIEKLKAELNQIDLNTDKRIMQTLNEDQRAILEKEFLEKIEAQRAARMEKFSE